MAHPHPFRFGVINEQSHYPQTWMNHARRVEDLGYATFLIRDHFVPDYFGDQLAPFSALTAAALATTTLRVGTLVIDNDYRHPVVLAKEAATLDALSGGRLELGLGAGWLRTEYAQAGLPFDSAGTRISRLAESLRVLNGLFADGPFTYAGEHYHVTNLNGYPKPIQRLRPPILLGGGQKRMLMLAGREADIISMLTTSVASGALSDDPTERLAESVRQKIEWVRQGAGERFDQIELNLIPGLVFTDDRQGGAEQLIRTRGWVGVTVEQVLAMPSVFIGTPEQMAAQMEERRAVYGFSYYVVPDDRVAEFAPIVARLAGR
ncbi:MAG: TIGR03621 family F420-dependent LLM class oxidoreductase [Chloroflexi bacterium]|nr:TIGR03621 family F420-dependent LLM class oxidoreductase [Chloroflexota bacterium]